MVSRIIILTSLVVLLAGMAWAQTAPKPSPQPHWRTQSRAKRWEITLQTRYTASQDYTADNGSAMKFEDDLGWGFGFNYHFNQKFNLGMVFTWRGIDYQSTIVDADNPDNTRNYNGKIDTSILALAGEWNILPGKVSPYINGSLGWYHLDTNIYAGSIPGCWWDPWWGYVCGSYPTTYGTNSTAAGLGVGVRWETGDSFFLRVGYERGWVDIEGIDGSNLFRLDFGLLN